MCIHRSSRHPKNKDKETQTRNKKKPPCCRRCLRKIRRFCCRRCFRCMKNIIFGTAKPALEHYEIAGHNLGSIKSKFMKNIKRKSVVTLFRNKLRPSKTALKYVNLIQGFDAKELQEKISMAGSKRMLLENMIDDYKKKNLSLSHLSSKFEPRKLDKDQIKTMLQDYDKTKKRMKDFEGLNAEYLKKKFSISGSRSKILDKMVTDYKKGIISATELSMKSKFDPKKLNKEEMIDMLKKYEAVQNDKNRISFLVKSKNRLMSLIDEAKNLNFSYSMFKKP